MTTNKPEVEGMETTAEEREQWTKRVDDAGRMARDFFRLSDLHAAEIASLRARLAEVEAEKAKLALDRDEALDRADELDRLVTRIDNVAAAIRARGESRT